MNTREIQVIRAGRGHVAELKSLFRDIVAESQPTSMEDQRADETGFDRSLTGFEFLASESFWILVARVIGRFGGSPVKPYLSVCCIVRKR